jgi:sporulation protein YhbH
MSIFREHKTSADRSASDRARHKQKIEKAIREGITDIVAEESIIGQDGKKKVKIPVRGIKEWQFIYGDNNQKSVGSSPGSDLEKDQIVKRGQQQGQAPGRKAGNDKGEEFYDVEIDLDELAEYLFDSLNLPDLERKKLRTVLEEKPKRHGTRTKGIPPRLDKKTSAIQRIKRLSAARRSGAVEIDPETGDEIFPFHENDLRYHHVASKQKEATNAVIFFMMDVSGSMTQNIKFLARSFYFLLYQFIRHKYEKVEIVFLAHTTEAFETDEDSFFKRGSAGGTFVSSAPELAIEIIKERYHPSSWNIYAFHCSDGDNFEEDNDKAISTFKELSLLSQLIGYVEIRPTEERMAWDKETNSKLYLQLSNLDSSLKVATINDKVDIWNVFLHFFGGTGEF